MRILCVAGSRGERAKLAPVVAGLAADALFAHASVSGEVPTWDAGAPPLDLARDGRSAIGRGGPEPVEGPPPEDLRLEIGERAPVVCVGAALRWAEGLLQQRNPDLVLTCGESDAALGAAFAASLAGVAVAHLDAGLVGDPTSPNGRLLDQAATFLLAPHVGALQRLAALGMEDCAYLCGDTLADGLTAVARAARGDRYCLCYLAQAALESPALPELFAALERIGLPALLPAAERAQARLAALNIVGRKDLRIVEPLDYLPMQQAVAGAALVITDSPTLQREAYLQAVVALGLVGQISNLPPPGFPEAERSGWVRPVALEEQEIVQAAQAAPPAGAPDIERHRGAGLRAAKFLTGL